MKKTKRRKKFKQARRNERAQVQGYVAKAAASGPMFFPSVLAATVPPRSLPRQPTPVPLDPFIQARIAAELKTALVSEADPYQREHAAALDAAVDADNELKARLARLV